MRGARILAQASWETRLLVRNGEQLLLTVVIPLGLLLLLTLTRALPLSADSAFTDSARITSALATVLTVSVISTAFTSLAIATGFERRSGALRLLATTPLSTRDLLIGKLLATLAVTALSTGIVSAAAIVLGWRPTPGTLWALPLLALGVAAWLPWALALAGRLRAEAVLAVANGIFLAAISIGGVVIPADELPGLWGEVVGFLPSGALDQVLTVALTRGAFDTAGALVLVIWAAAGSVAAVRYFRWS